MCFVRKALTYEEQNVILMQQEGSLYYVTKENIFPKQELKVLSESVTFTLDFFYMFFQVGYSRMYAVHYNLPVLEPIPNESNMYQCFECFENFLTSEEFQKHLDIHDEVKDDFKPRKKKKKLPVARNLRPEFVNCESRYVDNTDNRKLLNNFNAATK